MTHDRPPIQDVDLSLIDFPEEYQRDPSDRKARDIAASFDADACGPLTIARRGARFVIVDGNHRLVALRLLGIQSWPCVITERSQRGEASLFVLVNQARTRPTAMQVWKARLAAGDPVAVSVTRICSDEGVSIGGSGDHHSRPRKSRSVVALEKAYRLGGEALLVDVLQSALRAWPDEPRHLDADVVLGLTAFFTYYRINAPGTFDKARAVEKFSSKALLSIRQRAHILGAASGGLSDTAHGGAAGQPGFVKALLEVYNARLMSKRLEEPTSSGWKRVALALAAEREGDQS